jgi:hypothetical protein
VQPSLAGAVTCAADGSATITWTFTTTTFVLTVLNDEVVVSGAVSGTATFEPAALGLEEAATAVTAVPAGVAGQVDILVPWVSDVRGTPVSASVTVACGASAVEASPRTVG